MKTATAALFLGLTLAACGQDSRYLIQTPSPAAEQPVRPRSIEVREAVLPAYASAVEISEQVDDGALRNIRRTLWADDPVKGFTVELARSLDLATTARVAAEPWPLESGPDVVLEVRVDRMLARADGQFQLSGQYAIASPSGYMSGRLERFDIIVPMGGTDPAQIAAGAGAALARLSDAIVADLR